MHVQRSYLSERSKVGDMLFEDLRSDPSSAELEGSDERGNAGGRRWDGRAPALKARFVPEGDVFKEDQLTPNPPRSAYQRAAAQGDEVGAVEVGEHFVDEFGRESVQTLPRALHDEGGLTAGQRK